MILSSGFIQDLYLKRLVSDVQIPFSVTSNEKWSNLPKGIAGLMCTSEFLQITHFIRLYCDFRDKNHASYTVQAAAFAIKLINLRWKVQINNDKLFLSFQFFVILNLLTAVTQVLFCPL